MQFLTRKFGYQRVPKVSDHEYETKMTKFATADSMWPSRVVGKSCTRKNV